MALEGWDIWEYSSRLSIEFRKLLNSIARRKAQMFRSNLLCYTTAPTSL